MAGTLRSFSFKIVPPVQVISNLRKQLRLLHNCLPESNHSIIGLPSRSVFLSEFLCKRSLSSIPSVKVIEEKVLAPNQIVFYSPTLVGLAKKCDLHQNSCNFKVYVAQTSPVIYNKTANNHETSLTRSSLSQEVFFTNGQLHSVSFCTPSDQMFSDYEKRMIMLSESSKEPTPEPPKNDSGRPSPEQLHHVFEVLSKTLPKLFVHPLDYTIYHPQLIFENNIRGTRTIGLFHYVKQIALLRTVGHLKFAYVSFDILKITSHPEDGTVKVRWRIRGISALRVFLNFWKFNILKIKESIEMESESWYDGFSIFFVNSEGKVYKHIVDKMQPDPEEKLDTLKPIKPTLATKLAMMLGLTPRDCPDLTHLLSVLHESSRCLSDAMLPLDKIA